MAQKKSTTSTGKKTSRTSTSGSGFTADERKAMRERARELKAQAKREDGEKDLLEKIAEMPKADRAMAKKIHEIVMAVAPELEPKTWYGMPAYAKDGDVICFFQSADKFKSRYATFGFSDKAALDAGSMWPTSFALTNITATHERTIKALVRKAVG